MKFGSLGTPLRSRKEQLLCSAKGCEKKRATYLDGLCGMHHARMKRHGSLEEPPRGRSAEYMAQIRPKQIAKEITCEHKDRKHYAHGLCTRCYQKYVGRDTQYAWIAANKDRQRISGIRAVLKRHGLTIDQYDALLASQDGKCANKSCGAIGSPAAAQQDRRKSNGGLQVDHDHKTGAVRGLLCKSCNSTLGHVVDHRDRLSGLIEYLDKVGAKG